MAIKIKKQFATEMRADQLLAMIERIEGQVNRAVQAEGNRTRELEQAKQATAFARAKMSDLVAMLEKLGLEQIVQRQPWDETIRKALSKVPMSKLVKDGASDGEIEDTITLRASWQDRMKIEDALPADVNASAEVRRIFGIPQPKKGAKPKTLGKRLVKEFSELRDDLSGKKPASGKKAALVKASGGSSGTPGNEKKTVVVKSSKMGAKSAKAKIESAKKTAGAKPASPMKPSIFEASRMSFAKLAEERKKKDALIQAKSVPGIVGDPKAWSGVLAPDLDPEHPMHSTLEETVAVIEGGQTYSLKDLLLDESDVLNRLFGVPHSPKGDLYRDGSVGTPFHFRDDGIHRFVIVSWKRHGEPARLTCRLMPLWTEAEYRGEEQGHQSHPFSEVQSVKPGVAPEDLPHFGVRVIDPSGKQWVLGPDEDAITISFEEEKRKSMASIGAKPASGRKESHAKTSPSVQQVRAGDSDDAGDGTRDAAAGAGAAGVREVSEVAGGGEKFADPPTEKRGGGKGYGQISFYQWLSTFNAVYSSELTKGGRQLPEKIQDRDVRVHALWEKYPTMGPADAARKFVKELRSELDRQAALEGTKLKAGEQLCDVLHGGAKPASGRKSSAKKSSSKLMEKELSSSQLNPPSPAMQAMLWSPWWQAFQQAAEKRAIDCRRSDVCEASKVHFREGVTPTNAAIMLADQFGAPKTSKANGAAPPDDPASIGAGVGGAFVQ